jgi:hypothetical protein
MRNRGRRREFRWAVAGIVVCYALLQVLASVLFDVHLRAAAVPLDLLLHLAAGALLWRASRSTALFLIVAFLLMAALHLGHAAKIAFFGGPLMPDDFASLPALIRILEGPPFWALGGSISAAAILLAANFAAANPRSWAAALSLVALLGAGSARPEILRTALDRAYGHVEWDQRSNFETRGPALHLLHETARRLESDRRPPLPAEALQAAERLLGGIEPAALRSNTAPRNRARRNVHMIVLESFWDAGQLTAAGLSDDPLSPEFRALWDAGGRSRALSPVFGGHTANAEFEALCGFPVMHEGVVFETRLRRDVACLPRLLAEDGYATVASHPNVAVFWNRINAYRRIGFDTYWSAKDFDLDDMNGEFLSDRSLYRQVREKTAPLLETGTPTFNYVLTISGHIAFPLNEARPMRIGATTGNWFVAPYANNARYKSEELIPFVDELRRLDPTAIIVIFGDHLPFLDLNYGAYVESGLLVADRAEFTAEMELTASGTPLVVIDGEAGPLPVGDLPLYRLPALILELLGYDGPTIMDYTRTGEGLLFRPFPGYQLVLATGMTPVLCRDEGDASICPAVAGWAAAVETVNRDLFRGHGSAARGGTLSAPPPSGSQVLDGS